MAGADTSTASDIMKDYFLEGAQEELNNSSMLLAQIDRNTDDVEGDKIVAAHHVGRNAGIGARKEGETLPTPGSQSYARSEYFLYGNYGVGRISTRLMKAIKTNRGAFVNAAKEEMTRIKDDLKREINFQAWGDGTGAIAGVQVDGSADNDFVLDTPVERRVYNYLHIGMRIDVGTVANPTASAGNRQITAIDRSTGTVTVDGATFTTGANDIIFRAGSGGDGANQRVITGLLSIVDNDSTYAGIDPDDVPEWASWVDSVGGVLTEGVIEEAMDEVAQTGGNVPNLLVSTYAIQRKFANDLKADRQFVNPTVLRAGFKGIEISSTTGTMTMTADRDAPDGKVFGLSTGDLTQWEYADWEFLDEDGSVLHLVSGVAAYDFTLEKLHELGTTDRKSHFRLDGVTLS